MNKTKLLIAMLFLSLKVTFSQTPMVHLNFLTHNEDTPQWGLETYYTNNRAKIIQLAEYFASRGITWNMQSDYTYLNGVLNLETTDLMNLTNNKNILRWMYEDKGVEMDPHSHESLYNYPDVAKLMDSIGLPESKIIGGSLYAENNGINVWTNLINGQYGVIFPEYFWQPSYLMGGGTQQHVADLKYFGFWNPTSTSDYLTHNPASPLHHIGVGCEIKIKDTTEVSEVLAAVREVLSSVENGLYPANGIYVQNIFFEQGDLNSLPFYNKVLEIADSLNQWVIDGMADWKTLKESYTEWETVYNSEMFQWECGQNINSIEELSNNKIIIYPNPVEDLLKIEINSEKIISCKIYDISGNLMNEVFQNQIPVTNLSEGLYFILIETDKTIYSTKFIKN